MDLRNRTTWGFTCLPSISYCWKEVITQTTNKSIHLIKCLNHCLYLFIRADSLSNQSSNLSLHICTENEEKPDGTLQVCENLCPDFNSQEKFVVFICKFLSICKQMILGYWPICYYNEYKMFRYLIQLLIQEGLGLIENQIFSPIFIYFNCMCICLCS